ncbi:MAG: hypothetical protein ACLQVI_15000 [Polyangiaceae bacterium]
MKLIGSEARRPNASLKPFEPLIGEWRTTGTHPLLPGKPLHGRASFSWIEGGAFLVWRSEIDEPEVPSGTAILGSDDAQGTFFLLYFDERDVSRAYGVTIRGDVMIWSRDDPKFRQRMTFTIDADGSRIVSKGEMSREGKPWEGDLELTYERI